MQQTARFLAFAAILTWSSTATAVPMLLVTDSDFPIVDNVVQLPQNGEGSITLSILPDPDVASFSTFFQTGSSSLAVDSCNPGSGVTANCTLEGTTFDFQATFSPARTAQFEVGQVRVEAGDTPLGVTISAIAGSSIVDSMDIQTVLTGQVIARVVPEPSTALLTGFGLLLLSSRVRRR